jgi:hypothetical protein
MFGDKRTATTGYVREADREILLLVVEAHLRAIDQPHAVTDILAAAKESAGREQFMERIG